MSIYRLGAAFVAGLAGTVAAYEFFGRNKKTPDAKPSRPIGGQPYAKDDFVKITKGSFSMGSLTGESDEQPPHQVTLSYDFLTMKTEIQQGRYALFAQATGKEIPLLPARFKGDQKPQVKIDWNDADAHCRWVGEQLKGQKWVEEALGTSDWEGRLPYEFEWERMAKGESGTQECGTKTGQCTGDGIVYWDNSGEATANVCSKRGNYVVWGGLEVCDLSGNVWEWCQDGKRDYENKPVTDPKGPSDSWLKVLRGGSWVNDVRRARSAGRRYGGSGLWIDFVGARCVLAPRTPQK